MSTQKTAKKIQKSEPFSTGGLIRSVGFAMFAVAVVFAIAGSNAFRLSENATLTAVGVMFAFGVLLVVFGSEMAKSWSCSECGNGVGKDAKTCPTCREPLEG